MSVVLVAELTAPCVAECTISFAPYLFEEVEPAQIAAISKHLESAILLERNSTRDCGEQAIILAGGSINSNNMQGLKFTTAH